MTEILEILDLPIFSYTISSTEMRFIEIMEREIYLRFNSETGFEFQGEISGCKPDCSIDLSQILLEYAMSCGGNREQGTTSFAVTRFGEHLAEKLLVEINQYYVAVSQKEKLSIAIESVLKSMRASYSEENNHDYIIYSLTDCPLRISAKSNGISNNIQYAQLSFVALCKKIVNELAIEWKLVQHTEEEVNKPIRQIIIEKT